MTEINIFAEHTTIQVPLQDEEGNTINLDFKFRQPSDEEYYQLVYASPFKGDISKEITKKGQSNQQIEDTLMENLDLINTQVGMKNLLIATLVEGYQYNPDQMTAEEYYNKLSMSFRQKLLTEFTSQVLGQNTEFIDPRSGKKYTLSERTAGHT